MSKTQDNGRAVVPNGIGLSVCFLLRLTTCYTAMYLSRLLLLVLLLYPHFMRAQKPTLGNSIPVEPRPVGDAAFEPIRFEQLTTDDGLPENSVTCMIQDHLGFMWLGTQNGLVRYDGTNMTTFQYDPKNLFSLKGRDVRALHEDRNGDIWIGCKSLFRYERATGRFIEYARNRPEKAGPFDCIYHIYEDKQGHIWTITLDDQSQTFLLDRLDPRTQTWIYFRSDRNKHDLQSSHTLASNSVYLEGIHDVFNFSFEANEDGKLWVVTAGPTGQTLHWIDPKTNRFTQVKPRGNATMQAAFKQIGVLTTAGQYIFIASFEQGLFRLNARTGQIDHLRHDSRNPASLRCNTVAKVHPHRDGSVWVATSQGLDRFNPKTGEFTHLTSRPDDPTSPSPGMLKFLHEMPNGDMWFRSSQGLNYYHWQRKQFTRYNVDPTSGEGTLHGQTFLSFLVDKTGRAWIGTFHDGLNKQSRIVRFPLLTHDPKQANSLQSATVLTVYEAPSEPGIIWFGTDKGLDRLDKKTGRYTHYRSDSLSQFSLEKGGVSALAEDKKGRFWIGTKAAGLYQMNRKTGRFIRFAHNPADPNSLMVDEINALLPASDGTLWIGTQVGLDQFDPNRWTFTHYYRSGTTYSPALFARIDQLILAQRRLAAILHPGVNVDKSAVFTLSQSADLAVVAGGDLSLTQKFSYCWIEDLSGKKIWELSPNRSVSDGFDPDVRVQTDVIRLRAGQYRLRYKSVSGDKYTYGHWKSASPLHPELWGIQLLTITATESSQLRALIQKIYLRPGLSDGRIFTLREDKAGRIWIGSNDGGVNRIHPGTGQFKTYTNWLGGPGCVLSLIEEQQSGGFWVGDYLHGLLFLNRQGEITHRYAAGNGLPGNSVRGIGRDRSGHLWLSTNRSLVQFNPNTEQFRAFTDANGVQDLERSPSDNVFRASDGELYVAGPKGVHAFYPDQIQNDPVAPPVVLTDLLINGQPATLGEDGQLPAHVSIANQITLPHDQNALTFHFAALSYNRGSESTYAYQLAPIDTGWVQNGTIRQARFLDLRPGTYTLRVKAANADGVWNEQGTSLVVVIRPPWWQTWWAYVLYALALGGGIWAFVQYRSRALVHENRVLEEKVAQRTHQVKQQKDEIEQQKDEIEQQKDEITAQRDHLEETLTELQATQAQLIQKEKLASLGELTAGIAHEIQNPLNFVNNFAEVSTELIEEQKAALANGDVEEAGLIANDLGSNLRKIHHHGGRASSIVKGMLEHSRTEPGEKRPTDHNALAQEYLNIAYHGLRAKDKNFACQLVTDFDTDLGRVTVAPQEIGRVLLNLYNNAFYAVSERARQTSDPDYKPTVEVHTQRQADQVVIRVRDNGTGIPDWEKAKIFQPFFTTKPTGEGTGLGLSLSYDIVTKGHGGTLTVESTEGEGSTFRLTLPLYSY